MPVLEEETQPVTPQPFENRRAYLDTLLRVEYVRLQFYLNGEIAALSETDGTALNRFAPSMEDAALILGKKLLQGQPPAEDLETMGMWEQSVRARKSVTQEPGVLALEERFERAGLREFGRSALMLTLGLAADDDLRSIFSYFSGESQSQYPTAELCVRLWSYGKCGEGAAWDRLEEERRALTLLFPNLADSPMPQTEILMPDRRLLSLFLGDGTDETDDVYWHTPEEAVEPLLFRERERGRLECALERGVGSICLWGDAGAGKEHLLRHLCRTRGLGYALLTISFEEAVARTEEQNLQKFRIALREAVLRGGILAVRGMGTIPKERVSLILNRYAEESERYHVPLFTFWETEPVGIDGRKHLPIGLPALDEEQRLQVWEHYAKTDLLGEEVTLSSVANTFLFTPGQIRAALETARLQAVGDVLSRDLLYKACYSLADHKLGTKAKRVKTVFTWDALKLPPEDKGTLRDLCNRVKNQHIVLSQWGYSKLLPYGRGISAVFAGPPGTGKTMAAQVVAGELHMELYEIDLSQLIDKYVGETEKNIRMIFDEAKKSNSILFFDEADSIFGKRVEAASSNDRFANIEASMLLQCVEQYSGIAILATNNYTAIDPAFVRRFKYLIHFRMPDSKLRLDIWNSMFPKGVPLAPDADLAFLAQQFALSGAIIKNATLSGAFLAAEEGQAVGLLHLLKGIQRELVKEGRKLDASQLGPYAYLYPML